MKKQQPKPTDKYIVSQSNSLIEADYSQTNLPAKTMKIGRLIISKISPNDEDFRITKINNAAIRQYLGYKKNVPYNRFNADLEDICKRLNEQVIKVLTDKGTVLNAFFISSWEIDTKRDETTFEISGRLKEYLLQLKRNYTSYQLKNIPKLNSSYSIRMYELLSQYRRLGRRKFALEDLKKKLGCTYKLYGHFKDKALTKAQKELVKYTDIRFDFEELKKGRKVTEIVIYIYPNDPESSPNQMSLEFLEDAIELKDKVELPDLIKKEMNQIGISNENCASLWQKGFDLIESDQKRDAAKKRCRTTEIYFIEKLTLLNQSKTTLNEAGFFIKALKEDWNSPALFQKTKKTTQKAETQQKKAEAKALKLELKQLKKALEEQERQIFETLLSNTDTFIKAHSNSIQKLGKTYIKNIKGKYDSPIEEYRNSRFVSSSVNIYFRENYPDLFAPTQPLVQKMRTVKTQLELIESLIK